MKILLVDDDPRFTTTAQSLLEEKKYSIDVLNIADNIFNFIEKNNYDLLILDVIMPKTDGITICRKLRKNHQELPILLLTALQGKNDKLKAFEAGADDYLVKPFDWDELLARIRALLRRKETEETVTLKWGNLTLVTDTKQIVYDSKDLNLTPTEYQILEVFLTNPSKLFSIDDLISKLWDFDEIPTNSTIRSHIKGLRKKLKKIGGDSDLIQTVYGMGYRLKKVEKVKVEKKSENKEIKFFKQEKEINNQSQNDSISAALAAIWGQYQQDVIEDINCLNEYNQNINCQLTKEEAVRKAHSLVGFLGSIGFIDISHICKNIENLLRDNQIGETLQKEIDKLYSFCEKMKNENSNSFNNLSIEESTRKKNVLMIDSKSEFTDNFIYFANFWNLEIDLTNNLSYGLEKLTNNKFDLILFDIYLIKKHSDRKESLNQIIKLAKDTPIYIITNKDDFRRRLEVSDYKINGFISKDLSSIKIIQFITQNWNNINHKIVLALDDDEKFLDILESQLVEPNLKLITLNHPSKIWKFLDNITPDLIILDLQMPEINGIDVCKVIKNDLHWQKIPVIFLTAYLNDGIIDQIITVGANDFIPKSKLELELNNRIVNHLNMSST